MRLNEETKEDFIAANFIMLAKKYFEGGNYSGKQGSVYNDLIGIHTALGEVWDKTGNQQEQ